MGPTAGEEPGAAAEQAAILMSEGVDALLLETFRFPGNRIGARGSHRRAAEARPRLRQSLGMAGSAPSRPPGGWSSAEPRSLGSTASPERAPPWLSPSDSEEPLDVPLLVKPGVGTRPEEAMSPAELAAVVPKLLEHNVRLIGGCCGTNEQHVAAVAACLRHFIVYPFGHMTGDKA